MVECICSSSLLPPREFTATRGGRKGALGYLPKITNLRGEDVDFYSFGGGGLRR